MILARHTLVRSDDAVTTRAVWRIGPSVQLHQPRHETAHAR